jgi:hypothetical protein
MDPYLLEQSRILAYYLERISADSVWAHRSSGLRGELLRALDALESGEEQNAGGASAVRDRLERLISAGYEMLEAAARELVRSR